MIPSINRGRLWRSIMDLAGKPAWRQQKLTGRIVRAIETGLEALTKPQHPGAASGLPAIHLVAASA